MSFQKTLDAALAAARGPSLAVVSLLVLLAAPALAIPVGVEAGWSLLRTDIVDNAASAHYSPVDGLIYAARLKQRADGGGIVRIEADGSQTFIAEAARPRGIAIDPVSGDVFFTEAGFPGVIYRTPFGADSAQRSLWVEGFHRGDDDPIGLAIAPLDYTGNVVAPGQALMVDEGNGGPTEVWAWSPAAIDCSVSAVPGCADEFAIHGNDGTLLAATDITIGRDGVFLVDWGEIYEVFADGSLGLVVTDRPILAPSAIAVDPLTGDLYVMESGVTDPQTGLADDRILRVDPVTGAMTVVLSGFSFNNETTDATGLDVSPDGQLLIVTERLTNTVYTFENPLLVAVGEPATSALLLAGLGSCFAVRRHT